MVCIASARTRGGKGQAMRGEREKEEDREGKRTTEEAGRSRALDRAFVRGKRIDAVRGCAGVRGTGERGLKEAHCLPSEADNSVMNVTNARPRSGL